MLRVLLLLLLELRLGALTLPPAFAAETLALGLDAPTAMEIAPDGRIFICQQNGQLRIFKSGALLPQPFLSVPTDTTNERGLLGVTFDPAFASNQFVYIYYTVPAPDLHNRLARFSANGDLALPGSAVTILDLEPLSASNHNGGAIHFGTDGMLYVGVGENNVPSNSQSLNNRLGKLLRINPDGSIPPDNPFFLSASGLNRAIWALGLRNPFTFAVQPGSGRIFIDDVGQSSWEEIDQGRPGANYGWPTVEGPSGNPAFDPPLYTYSHLGGACSIVAGCFYNPPSPSFPASYINKYFFGDLCDPRLRTYDYATGAVEDFAGGFQQLVDSKVSQDGSLYTLMRGGGGALFRISYGPGAAGSPDAAKSGYRLFCAPNPAAQRTLFSYELPEEGSAEIRIFNVQGELVRLLGLGRRDAGRGESAADLQALAEGIYLAELHASGGPKAGFKFAVRRP
jgi:glucose/arabinose dehydrogenase